MKKILCFLLSGLFVICLTACGSNGSPASDVSELPSVENSVQDAQDKLSPGGAAPSISETSEPSSVGSTPATEGASSNTDAPAFTPESDAVSIEDDSNKEDKEETNMEQTAFYVMVGGETFSATFADNSGALALKELLDDSDITIRMSDYGGFEKVGSLDRSLPTENSQTTTQTGDIVLYQGNQIVIFYGSNSWSYTRLGKIDDLTGWQEALGSGDVAVTFSLQGE